MGKKGKKKSSRKEHLAKVAFATATVDLLIHIVDLIKSLIS